MTGLAPPFYAGEPVEYDAILIVSFGGPEGPDDVMPFLDKVFRGLRVTDETRHRIAERYQAYGGVSPINGHTREFIAALEAELDRHGPKRPVYWGNRNWHPLLRSTVEQMAADGIRRAAAFVTSTFSSYSGCRKYREDLYDACAGVPQAPVIDKLRVGFNHPGFVAAATACVRSALDEVPLPRRGAAKILFTAHSLPRSMAASSPYVAQLADACASVANAVGPHDWELVYQSNNARYGGEPWLGPDIGEALAAECAAGRTDVVVAPIGFVCDHMEVVLDLDVDAAARARELGIHMVRAGTVGTHPAYVAMARELIVERMQAAGIRATVGSLGPKHDLCPADCCLSGRPGPPKPALGGTEAPAYTDAAGGS